MNWFWLALGAAILWGLGYTINQSTLKFITPIELLFFESVVVSIVVGLYLLYTGEMSKFYLKLQNPRHLLQIMTSTVIYVTASMLIFKSISSSNATLAAIIESCYPIFTVIFAFLIYGQLQLNLASAIGFAMILGGIILVKLFGH